MKRPGRFILPRIALAGVVVAGALAAGCSSKPLVDHNPDGGLDVGGDVGLPFAGQRSYVVTALLQRDGGFGDFPDSHKFTLVLDADRRTAIAGGVGVGEGFVASFEPTASGALHFTKPFSFAVPGCGSGGSIDYSDLTIAIDASDRLTGTGQGQVNFFTGDVGSTADATMSLMGDRDTQPPTLPTYVDVDPFLSFWIPASEPLPPDTNAALRAPDGQTIALLWNGTPGICATRFGKASQILRYATQYQIVADGLTDFAGNVATGSMTLTTLPLPPLAAEDGFESVTGATFGGGQVLSGAGDPTITGTKSVYLAPTSGSFQFAVRLSVAAGDTTLSFAFRTVTPGASSTPSFSPPVSWALGSEGGTSTSLALPASTGASTNATIGGAPVTIGPITTASVPLPADVTNEVVLYRSTSASCGFPLVTDGIIIDDVRVE